MSNYPVSIIVPIYNAEKYIEKCVVSLFEQDFIDIEYVFVNDCTPDNSIAILEELMEKYPNRKPHIKIIHHEQNKGSGAARKTGILNATGEYNIQIDSDDWCELNMISSLYQKAKEDNADMVVCDFYRINNNSLYYEKANKSNQQIIFSEFLSGKIPCSLWNKLIKKNIYTRHKILPSEIISMAEDRHLIIRLSFFCKRISYLSKPLIYYRQDNMGALTKQFDSKKVADIKYFIKDIEVFLKKNDVFEQYKYNFFKTVLEHKIYILTFYNSIEDFIKFYPQVNKSNLIFKLYGYNIASFLKSILFVPIPFKYQIFRYIYLKYRQ